jgi:Secretion system C-terminal sorting domain
LLYFTKPFNIMKNLFTLFYILFIITVSDAQVLLKTFEVPQEALFGKKLKLLQDGNVLIDAETSCFPYLIEGCPIAQHIYKIKPNGDTLSLRRITDPEKKGAWLDTIEHIDKSYTFVVTNDKNKECLGFVSWLGFAGFSFRHLSSKGVELSKKKYIDECNYSLLDYTRANADNKILLAKYEDLYISGVNNRLVLSKVDEKNQLLWSKTISATTNSARIYQLDQNVYIIPTIEKHGIFKLTRILTNGNISWTKTITQIDTTHYDVNWVGRLSNSQFVVSMTGSGGNNPPIQTIACFDVDGTFIWQKKFTKNASRFLLISQSRNIIIPWTNSGKLDSLIILNKSGTKIGVRKYNLPDISVSSMIELSKDKLLLLAYSGGPSKISKTYLYIDDLTKPVGLEETSNQTLCKVYPNPATQYLTVEKLNTDFEMQKMDIYNTLGNLILTLESSGNSLDISTLPNGFYFYDIFDKQNKRQKGNFVKQ